MILESLLKSFEFDSLYIGLSEGEFVIDSMGIVQGKSSLGEGFFDYSAGVPRDGDEIIGFEVNSFIFLTVLIDDAV